MNSVKTCQYKVGGTPFSLVTASEGTRTSSPWPAEKQSFRLIQSFPFQPSIFTMCTLFIHIIHTCRTYSEKNAEKQKKKVGRDPELQRVRKNRTSVSCSRSLSHKTHLAIVPASSISFIRFEHVLYVCMVVLAVDRRFDSWIKGASLKAACDFRVSGSSIAPYLS